MSRSSPDRRRWCVGFDEDALARAALDGVDRRLLVAAGDVERSVVGAGDHETAVVDVADAVVEHDEQVRAVIDAQPGAGAAVLIDPDLHGHPSAATVHRAHPGGVRRFRRGRDDPAHTSIGNVATTISDTTSVIKAAAWRNRRARSVSILVASPTNTRTSVNMIVNIT